MVMQNYTIHCTLEQTKKALSLGAPIEILSNYAEFRGFPFIKCQDGNERPYIPPTAEQMIGWLEEQGLCVETHNFAKDLYLPYTDNGKEGYNLAETDKYYSSRKEATLVAIDAALEYLVKNNKRK